MSKKSIPNLVELKPVYKSCLEGFDKLPDSASVPVQVVAAIHTVTPVTIWRWSKSGKLPAPHKRGGATRWNVGDLRRSMSSAK